jgi:membrane protein DedA with SNARE-associated domain
MKDAATFLIEHGYVVLFVVVLADQIGLPLPALPFLLAAGAVARSGALAPGAVVALAIVASLLGHLVWYEAGRRKGAGVLALLCRISIEPDACVRQTENLFDRFGAKSLIIADFIPGLGIVVQPLAGMSGMGLARFLVLGTLGALVWSGSLVSLGWIFSDQLELLAESAEHWGARLVVVCAVIVAAYFGLKLIRRYALLRRLSTARIRAEEVKAMIDRGEPLAIIDLRHHRERQSDPKVIPGAIVMTLDEVDIRYTELPADREIILYCS